MSSRLSKVLIALSLVGLTLSSIFAAYSNRSFFWFPYYLLDSLVHPLAHDWPRMGYLVLVFPSFILGFLAELFNADVLWWKQVGISWSLSLHGAVALSLVTLKAFNSKERWAVPFILGSFGLLFLPVAPVSFNGSLCAYSFFILCLFPVTKKDRFWTYFIPIYLCFYFSYPPATLLGSIILFIDAIYSKHKKKAVLTFIGLIVAALYLIFLHQLPVNKTYDETFWAYFELIKTWRLHSLVIIAVAFLLQYLRPNKWIRLLSISLMFFYSYLVWSDYTSHESVTWLAYHNRLLLYVLLFPISALVLLGRHFNFKPKGNGAFYISIISIALGIFIDFKYSVHFNKVVESLAQEAQSSAEACVETKLNFDKSGVFTEEYPLYSFIFREKFQNKILYFKENDRVKVHSLFERLIYQYCSYEEPSKALLEGSFMKL